MIDTTGSAPDSAAELMETMKLIQFHLKNGNVGEAMEAVQTFGLAQYERGVEKQLQISQVVVDAQRKKTFREAIEKAAEVAGNYFGEVLKDGKFIARDNIAAQIRELLASS